MNKNVSGTLYVHFTINNSPKKYKLFIVFVLRFQFNFTLTVFYKSDPLPTNKQTKKLKTHSCDTLAVQIHVQLRLLFSFFLLALNVVIPNVQSKCNKVVLSAL